jgi:hypothetical protein
MSNPSPAKSSIGPVASIAVDHVLGAKDPFKFRSEIANRVTLDKEGGGNIRIHWQENDQEAQLDFRLNSTSGVAFLDGILLGWSGDDMPANGSRPLSYRVEVPREHTLVVKLERSKETYTYLLYVSYKTPEGRKTDTIDPKIYNEGDGGPESPRR